MYRKLPEEIRKQAQASYQLFKINPYHPSLHFKCIGQRVPMYSARIGIGYRAVGLLEGDTVHWWWIGSHGEYDKLRF